MAARGSRWEGASDTEDTGALPLTTRRAKIMNRKTRPLRGQGPSSHRRTAAHGTHADRPSGHGQSPG